MKALNMAYNILKKCPICREPHDETFYMTVVFNEAVLNNKQTLPIETRRSGSSSKSSLRQHRARQTLCILPAGLDGHLCRAADVILHAASGFRLTLLETDEDRFECTVKKLGERSSSTSIRRNGRHKVPRSRKQSNESPRTSDPGGFFTEAILFAFCESGSRFFLCRFSSYLAPRSSILLPSSVFPYGFLFSRNAATPSLPSP